MSTAGCRRTDGGRQLPERRIYGKTIQKLVGGKADSGEQVAEIMRDFASLGAKPIYFQRWTRLLTHYSGFSTLSDG